ncbi:hypothetical protein B0A55_03064 [Friedmanniomyces simplex]|uniref:Metalloendopeptidase n=1 Tax=Friedmanniomyces simplex TaxID=329884 RepID=A0A4U0XSR4_9PEZI|nr:hypothetical protein B0A55_03064 [Friedmanniomyces simplex]
MPPLPDDVIFAHIDIGTFLKLRLLNRHLHNLINYHAHGLTESVARSTFPGQTRILMHLPHKEAADHSECLRWLKDLRCQQLAAILLERHEYLQRQLTQHVFGFPYWDVRFAHPGQQDRADNEACELWVLSYTLKLGPEPFWRAWWASDPCPGHEGQFITTEVEAAWDERDEHTLEYERQKVSVFDHQIRSPEAVKRLLDFPHLWEIQSLREMMTQGEPPPPRASEGVHFEQNLEARMIDPSLLQYPASLNMLFAIITALLGLILLPSITAYPLGNTTRSLLLRWYGVPYARIGDYGAWPVTVHDPALGNQQPLRYCYSDMASADSLAPLLSAAITKWNSAIEVSALAFILDPGCKGNKACLCDSFPQPSEALYVFDRGQSATRSSHSTIGYEYTSQEAGGHNLNVFDFDPKNSEDWASSVLEIAHELGHVLGLAHEHQRPDRDNSVIFTCGNLSGYELAEADVEVVLDNTPAPIPECRVPGAFKSTAQCMDDVVCQNEEYADLHFPQVIDWLKGSASSDYGDFTTSQYWDSLSIMNYGSYGGAADVTQPFPAGAVLVGRGTGAGEANYQIYQGGDIDPVEAGPSPGDVSRVKRLHNKQVI